MYTRKNFLHKRRGRFTQRGGKARASKPPRAPKAKKAPKPPKAPKAKKPPKTAKAKKPQQAANPASKRSQKKARAERKKSETPKQKADRAAAAKKAGKEKFAASGSVRKSKKEKKANKAATKKKKADADPAAAKKKKADADAAAKKKKADADAAAKKKKADADAAAKKKKADADAAAKKKKKDDGKSSMLPPMLSSGLGALGSLASKIGDALVDALDNLKDMMGDFGDGPFGSGPEGGPEGGPGGPAGDEGYAKDSGSFSGSADSSCSPEQQAEKNKADAVRLKSLEAYPTNPKIALILAADKIWKKTMDSTKPPIVGNCEPKAEGEEKKEEKEPTDATVPKTVTDEEFLESWRQFEVIIEIKPITKQTTYTTIKQAIERSLYKAKIDQDKAAIYAASRVILDPINTRRYLDILKKQELAK